MTNREYYKRLIDHCISPVSRHSYCNDLIKPYYYKSKDIQCARYNPDGSVWVRNCDDCKKNFSLWLNEEYDPNEDPHYLDAYV